MSILGSNLTCSEARSSGTSLPQSYYGATLVTIPRSVAPGSTYAFQVCGDVCDSDTIAFDVTTAPAVPATPRADDVMVDDFIITGTSVRMGLLVGGANIDAGASLQVVRADGSVLTSSRTGLVAHYENLRREATMPSTLAYPIHRYGLVRADVTVGLGEMLTLRVVNEGGAAASEVEYQVAASLDELDRDGDALPDTWEVDGYDHDGDGADVLDLAALGANPRRKDIFVEVDNLPGIYVSPASWTAVEAMFDTAPVLNPDGSTGIRLYVDRGQSAGGGGGQSITVTTALTIGGAAGAVPLETIKSMAHNRCGVFRYGFLGDKNGDEPGASGYAEVGGDDFMITLTGPQPTVNRFWPQTFAHELGHTLGLLHGGDENRNYKPNYNSVMVHHRGDWETTMAPANCMTGSGDKFPPQPSQFGGIDTDCALSACEPAGPVLGYSQGQRAAMSETAILESAGVCDGVGHDLNGDGTISGTAFAGVITSIALATPLRDHADWANLEYGFTHAPCN
ncbi:MAG: hypothetical protein RIT81_15665 [Deltaproteobacteria bacterium]